MSSSPEPGPADHHLGESLAALVDGELSHDRRDRVLAHLATCPSCKAEADAQRRLKSVFAQSPLPTPPQDLLARLQGLPALAEEPPPPPPGSGPKLPPGRPEERDTGLGRGFRIHEPGAVARLPRGHRLAFAAAGAVSLAAFAIGGAVSGAGSQPATVSASGSTASTAGQGGSASPTLPARSRGAEAGEGQDRSAPVLPVSLVSRTMTAPTGAAAPVPPFAWDSRAAQLFPLLAPQLVPGAAPSQGAFPAASPGQGSGHATASPSGSPSASEAAAWER
ncbi:anti-sigma factor [Streptomyces sp. 7-21]|uniref:anti-sigma factor family protein n=1 Tax=Streptomyces sp. 7-21 TaxID=2802283 RepID=UPI00191DFFD7|nr:zf-HC2 domain-containing protein [Streptomyces sp. 7-21]MBL1066290.1 zf-HC2 domain-containing protein [Streptomyces sp. 7-21]